MCLFIDYFCVCCTHHETRLAPTADIIYAGCTECDKTSGTVYRMPCVVITAFQAQNIVYFDHVKTYRKWHNHFSHDFCVNTSPIFTSHTHTHTHHQIEVVPSCSRQCGHTFTSWPPQMDTNTVGTTIPLSTISRTSSCRA